MSAQAAWLADPTGSHELRYWNGSAWTEHVSDGGNAATDPVPEGIDLAPPPDVAAPPPPPPAAAASGGGGGWKDKLKQAAQSAADQGKAAADKAKTAVAEQQAKRTEQMANDPNTLWFGESQTVAGKATGMSKARYRITSDRVWVETGVLGVTSEQVPMWAIKDIDVRQNVLQRGKDIGDVVLRLEDPSLGVDPTGALSMSGRAMPEPGRTAGELILDNIEAPYAVRDLLMPLVSEARTKKTIERQSQYVHQMTPGAASQAAPAAAPAPVDMADQLRKLAQLRDEGILSEEEFATQKTKLLGT